MEELGRLRASFDASGSGGPRLMLVAGEAGVGKSRLVGEFAAGVRRRGGDVVEAACLPMGAPIAFGPFVEMLGADLFGEARGPDRLELFRRVADRLAAETRAVPRLVVVEDLQWADPATCDLLLFCVRVLPGEGVRFVATYRSDQVGATSALAMLLAELGSASWVDTVELAPLTRAEMAEQVAGIRGTRAGSEMVERLHARSGGNPLFAEELLAADPAALVLPDRLRAAVLTRLGRLCPAARAVARLLAVAGPRVAHELLLASSDLDAHVVDAGVIELRDNAMVVIDAGHTAFRHALVAEAVLSDLAPGEASRLHRRLASLLAERPELVTTPSPGGAAAARVHHWEAAGEHSRALDEAMRAVAATDSGGTADQRLAHLERVLRLWGRVADPQAIAGTDHASLLEAAGFAAVAVERFERAVEFLEAARTQLEGRAGPHRLAYLLAQLSLALYWSGRATDARRRIDEAAALIPHEPPTAELAFVLARQALAHTNDWDRSIELARRAIPVAVATGHAAAEAVAQLALGSGLVCKAGERDEDGLAAYDRALALTRDHGDLRTRAAVAANVANAYGYLGRVDQMISVTTDARRALGRIGATPAQLARLSAFAAAGFIDLGRLDEAERELRSIEPVRSSVVDEHRLRLLVKLCTLRGCLDEARGWYADWRSLDLGGDRRDASAAVGVPLAVASKNWDDARALALEGLRTVFATKDDEFGLQIVVPGLQAEADRSDAGQTDADADAAREELVAGLHKLAYLQHAIHPTPRAETIWSVPLALAEASRAAGVDDPALWREAVAAADATMLVLPQAYGRFRLANALLTQRGGRREGAALLAEAHRRAEAMGATLLAGEIMAAARRFGVELGVPAPADSDPLERFRLTSREREVLTLVAAGLSNREIADRLYISTKTASVHVTNILRKLGVDSRVQAAALAYRAGNASP